MLFWGNICREQCLEGCWWLRFLLSIGIGGLSTPAPPLYTNNAWILTMTEPPLAPANQSSPPASVCRASLCEATTAYRKVLGGGASVIPSTTG